MRNFALTIILLAITANMAGAQTHGVVIATDYVSAGTAGLLDLSSPWAATPDLTSIHHDAVGRWHDGLVYIVNRGGADNIQVLDPAANLSVVRQYSLGLDRNIHDIAFLEDGTAYVSCYDTTELLHIDPVTGVILHVVSTAAFADADGLPETSRLFRLGQRLFLTCERLDREAWYAPVGDSYVLVLDTTTRTWIDCDAGLPGTQGILLAAANPYTDFVRTDDGLLIGCNGFYAVADGGVDVIDPQALVSLGLEITEAELGGDVVALAGGADGRRHAIVSNTSFVTSVVAYDDGSVVQVLDAGTAYDHAAVAWDGDFQLFVADRTTGAAGVRVFDAASGSQLTSGPIGTGLPPALFVLPEQSAVPVLGLPQAGLTLAAPWPNPANPRTRVAFQAPANATVELRLIDLRGRLVRHERMVAGADGLGIWEFDGHDRRGRAVASGTYRCVVSGGGGFAARSLTIVR